MNENKKDKIIIADYSLQWAEQFNEIKKGLLKFIGEDQIKIEHVGSTSIRGLKAKPIIDLDIIIEDDEGRFKRVLERLEVLGYIHVGDLGVSGREAFKKLNKTTPNFGSNKEWFDHHLYLCKEGSVGLRNHVTFRDYLRTHPEMIKEYGELKEKLAKKYPYDIDSYIDGKTDFIIEILKRAGLKEKETKQIEKENKLK